MSVTHFILYYTHFNKKTAFIFVHTLYNPPLKPLSHIQILSLKSHKNLYFNLRNTCIYATMGSYN